MAQADYVTETQTLRRIARDPKCQFWWTKHALKAVQDDGRTTLDVETALTNGQVILVEWKQDVLWRVLGTDLDGASVEAVVAVYEDQIVIKVVTTF